MQGKCAGRLEHQWSLTSVIGLQLSWLTRLVMGHALQVLARPIQHSGDLHKQRAHRIRQRFVTAAHDDICLHYIKEKEDIGTWLSMTGWPCLACILKLEQGIAVQHAGAIARQ